MPAGREIMTSKRKRDDDRKGKIQRRKKSNKPQETVNSEKRQALRRLFGRICSSDLENRQPTRQEEDYQDEFFDENEDPLLDSVPVDMDPEQLGFLVCAQETLRFLHGRGIPIQHPVFTRLRSRLLRGIDELAMA